MNEEELVANLGTIARSGSKVSAVAYLKTKQKTVYSFNIFLLFFLHLH